VRDMMGGRWRWRLADPRDPVDLQEVEERERRRHEAELGALESPIPPPPVSYQQPAPPPEPPEETRWRGVPLEQWPPEVLEAYRARVAEVNAFWGFER
jgi:hypothetical protein